MEFFALSGLLNAVASIGLASFIYFRSPKDPRHWTFGLFGIATAIWSLGYFFWQISESYSAALWNVRLLMAGAIFIPVTFLHHVFYLLNLDKDHENHKLLKTHYAIGGLFLLSDLTPYFVSDVQPISIFPYWGVPGIAFHVCLVWWFGLVAFAHFLLIRSYFAEKGLKRRQFLFLLIGSSIGYLGGATNFPLWYEINILPYGTACFAIYISFVAYTLMRLHWLEFSIYVEKSLSYFTILLLISQPIYPALLLAQKAVLGTINLRYSIVQLLIHILTVVGAYQMKAGTKGAVARTILRGRELKVQTLAQFSMKVSACKNLRELGSSILETLGKGVGASQASLFMYNHESNHFDSVASFGISPDHPLMTKSWTCTDSVPQVLMFEQKKISVDDLLCQHPSEDWEQSIGEELKQLGIGWCFPFFGNGQLLGFLTLGPVSPEFFCDLGGKSVWDTIIQESTLALENAVLRSEVQRSQQLLCQMDRVHSLEVMAQGLTQELHNPLLSMKTFVQLAQLRKNDGEFIERLQKVVGEDLGPVERLTDEIRGYVRHVSHSLPTEVCFHELVDMCLLFFAANPAYQAIVIEKQYLAQTSKIVGDRQSVMQALFNGLRFLLKDNQRPGTVLRIDTYSDLQTSGKGWLQARFMWKTPQTGSDLCPVSLEGMDVEDYEQALEKPSSLQGLMVASRIIQQQLGILRLLMTEETILGFQVDMPVSGVVTAENPSFAFPGSGPSLGLRIPHQNPQSHFS